MGSKRSIYAYGGIIGFFVVFFGIAVPFCIFKVQVNQIGVWTKVWPVGVTDFTRGVVEEDYFVGWHRGIPIVDYWDVYDATVQTLNRTSDKVGGRRMEPIQVRTVDDYDVSVELILKYKIRRGSAWRLRKLLGPGKAGSPKGKVRYQVILENEMVDVARSVFGKMTEKHLYDPYEKRKRAKQALVELQKRMDDRFLDMIDVLLLDLKFDPKLDRKIKNVKLAELDILLNISQAKAADYRGITNIIDADTEAWVERIEGDRKAKFTILEALLNQRIAEIMAAAGKYMVEKKANADRYKADETAAGRLLVRKALAEGQNLKRAAMIGVGGDLIVALEAAKNINLGYLEFTTQRVDLLEIEQMVQKFGVAPLKATE
ncbi:MAG: SPFH domain-containing protein [Candidatus Brocadiales bacterium]|nr:SPFH domain-containing protein [Candidatus Bathyanammoxibius amoris]